MPTTTRRSLLAAAALSPLGAIPLNADQAVSPVADPDAEMFALIAACARALDLYRLLGVAS